MIKIRQFKESKGSYFDNKKLPREGDNIFFLYGFNNEIKRGTILLISNIDRKGLGNTYFDIESNQRIFHVPINSIFDHRPKLVTKEDLFGKVKVWEFFKK